jgi:acid phosphatase type 7
MATLLRMHPICLTLLLVACGSEPIRPAPTPIADDLPSVNDCTLDVIAPGPAVLTEPPRIADGHEEVYGAAPEPYHVRLGWPSNDPSTGIGFLWRTDVDTLATVVEYGSGEILNQRVEGGTYLYGGVAANEGPNRMHEVHLCDGLSPGTEYRYRVGGDGHWSDIYSFTTPQAPGTFDTFRIGFAGDSRGSYEVWGQVLAAIDARDVDFILFGGDMVDLGPIQEQWDDWFEATGDILARKVLVPAHGNHEYFASHYFASFAVPGNEQWFHHRYGNLVLLSLNDTVLSAEHITVDQPAFIDATLKDSDADWRFAYHHQSPYTITTTHASNQNLREHWVPKFEANGVQAVLNGHNHTYERSVPIRTGAEVAPGDGPIYIVSGGAGAPLYTSQQPEWFNVVANAVEHYIIIDVAPEAATFTAYDLSGNVLDTFQIPHPSR